MKLLVLGGSGLLGQAIVRESRTRSYQVISASRSEAELSFDITDNHQLDRLLKMVRPDAILNCAALTAIPACEKDPEFAYAVNARPLAFLASWSKRTQRPIVHISTDHFFCGDGDKRHSEQDPVTLVNEYARTKFAGEQFALTAPLALVLRTNIVGIRGWSTPTFAEWAVRSIEQSQPMNLFDDAFVSSIDVRACARGALLLMERGATGLVNLGSRNVFSKGDFIRTLARHLGMDLRDAQTRSVRDLMPRRADSLGLDIKTAEKKLGHRLPDLEEVVTSVIEQYRNRNEL